jgi:DNA-binding LacI/PurR family transcriptional regulator
MAKAITSHDVARAAGVSQATVSRALRNLPGTAPQTRAAVLEAAARLSYLPSDPARSLSTRSTRRVAVVAEELTNPYYPQLVAPVQRHLSRAGLRTVLVTDGATADGPGGGVAAEELGDGSYDGVILMTTLRTSRLPRDLTERGIPHVLVNRVLDHAESPSCTVDNAAGAMAVSELVARLGHRHVAAIFGPTATSTGRERALWLRRGLRHHGIALPRKLVRCTGFGHDTGMAAAHSLLDESPRPSALVCANDVLALGALSAARQCGLRVPEDLTVVGFDDIAAAEWPIADLTTVRVDLDLLASTAVEMLLAEVGNAGPAEAERPMERRIPVELRLRGTHGPAASLS